MLVAIALVWALEVREPLKAVVGPQWQILPWGPASSLPSASLPAPFKARDAQCQGSLFTGPIRFGPSEGLCSLVAMYASRFRNCVRTERNRAGGGRKKRGGQSPRATLRREVHAAQQVMEARDSIISSESSPPASGRCQQEGWRRTGKATLEVERLGSLDSGLCSTAPRWPAGILPRSCLRSGQAPSAQADAGAWPLEGRGRD